MDCAEASRLLDRWLDGELDAERSAPLEAHLAGCAACAAKRRELEERRAALRAALPRHRAPAALAERVRAAARSEARGRAGRPEPAPHPRASATHWGWMGLGAAVATLAFAGLLDLRAGDGGLAREAIADHVRSLMPGHLEDVASSDHHTVKPWFNGRLDFSPPVPQLESEGFSLVGGRLDVLGGHTVAALVYARRRHLINVFVWPASEPPQPRASESRGYHVRWGEAGGMAFGAVSDLDSAELETFVRAFRARAAVGTAPPARP
jgi:anti-sigma factor RsiW